MKRATVRIAQVLSLAMLVASCVSSSDEIPTDQANQRVEVQAAAEPAAHAGLSTPAEDEAPELEASANSCKFINFPALHCSPGCCLVVNKVTGVTTCIDCE